MKNPLDLRRQAAALIEEAKAIQERAEAEGRKTTEQEDVEISSKLTEAGEHNKEAARIEAIEQAAAGLKEIISPMLKEPQPTNGGTAPAEPKDHAEEARHGWKHIGEFAKAVWAADPKGMGVVDKRLFWSAATGMQQAIGSDGGFLVPPAFSTTIWDGMNAAPDNLLARTDQYTVEGESLTLPANAETSRATGSRYGGVYGYWIAEADQMTASHPKVRWVKLEPQQMAVMVPVTDKLLKNSPVAITQLLTRAATDEILFLTGDAIVNGTGAGQPKGLMASGSLVSVAKETGQAAKTIVSENIVKMWARLHPKARSNAIWLINVDVEPQLFLMTVGVGTSGLPAFMPAGGLSGVPYATLMGKPIVYCEYCATLGTVGDIILCDLKGVASGTQGGIESAMSMHLRFDYNESVFRFLFSVDSQPWLQTAITPFKGTNTLTTHVALATRA